MKDSRHVLPPLEVKVKSSKCLDLRQGIIYPEWKGETEAKATIFKVPWISLSPPTGWGCIQVVQFGVQLGPECCPVL